MIKKLPRIAKNLLLSVGLDLRLRTDDRHVLESVIFPFCSGDPNYHRILFVGCDWYTAVYPALFRGRDFWTIDIDPSRRRYGAAQHIVDSVANLRSHFPTNSFDLIIFNGVIGYGLDDSSDIEKALDALQHCLKPGGILVIGWNKPAEKDSRELAKSLRPFIFPSLGVSEYITRNPNHHTFSFFQK